MTDRLLACCSDLFSQTFVFDQVDDSLGAFLGAVDEISVFAVLDLDADPSAISADHGAPLPHRLGDGEAKSFPQGFLQHDIGSSLESIDFEMPHLLRVGK